MAQILRRLRTPTLVVVLLGGVWAFWQATLGRPVEPAPPPPPPGVEGEAVPELVAIEPGLVVSDRAPTGWTHLVLKTFTKLETGDLGTLPSFAKDTATRFRTVLLADVRPGPRGYALRRVGVGLALSHEGQEIVVASSALDRLGVPASLLDTMVLGRAEKAVARGRLAARSPTFALYDASVEWNDAGRHESIYLRYALLVEPEAGVLRTFCWPVAADPADRVPPETLVEIPSGTIFHCGIHVLAERAFGQIPVSWLFAMNALPPGPRLTMPERLQPWSIRDPRTADGSRALEAVLREALDLPGPEPEWRADSSKKSKTTAR